MKTLVNTTGIIFSTFGSFVVWHFIAQLNFADKEEYLKGNGVVTITDPTRADLCRFRREILFSKVGIALIIIGGIFQAISNYL